MTPAQIFSNTNKAITEQLNIYRIETYGSTLMERMIPPNDQINNFLLWHSDLVAIQDGDFSKINQLISKLDSEIIEAHDKFSIILSHCANIVGVPDKIIDFHIIDTYLSKNIALLLNSDKNYVWNALDSHIAELESKTQDEAFITHLVDENLLPTYSNVKKIIKYKNDFFKKSRTTSEPLIQIRFALVVFRHYFQKAKRES